MAAFLDRVSYGSQALDRGHGLVNTLVNKGERYGAALGFGFLKGYYREKMLIGGKVPADLAVGVVATLAGAGLDIFTMGRSGLSSHLHAVGDTGVQSYLNSIGAAWGAKKSGRTVYVLDEGAKAPAQLPAGMAATQVVGAIPQAVGGAYLSPEEIAHFSVQR